MNDITNSTDSRHMLALNRLSLLIDGITHSDEGEYILEATNEAGTRSNSTILTVSGIIYCTLYCKHNDQFFHSYTTKGSLQLLMDLRIRFVVREMK